MKTKNEAELFLLMDFGNILRSSVNDSFSAEKFKAGGKSRKFHRALLSKVGELFRNADVDKDNKLNVYVLNWYIKR